METTIVRFRAEGVSRGLGLRGTKAPKIGETIAFCAILQGLGPEVYILWAG